MKKINNKLTDLNLEFIYNNYEKISIKNMSTIFKVDVKTIQYHIKRKGIWKYKIKCIYDYDTVLELCSKFQTIKDLKDFDVNLYAKARKLGIIEKLRHTFKSCGNMKNKYVYVYILKDDKIYVGQTYNFKVRHSQHLSNRFKESDILKIYISKLLKVERATLLEETLRLRYVKHNRNVLNKRKCASVGGSITKWKSLEDCKKIAEKYKYPSEWREKESGSYEAARKNGWLKECNKIFNKKVYTGKPVKSLDTGVIYQSAACAARSFGKNRHAVILSIYEKHKCAGQTFVYLTPEEILEWKAKQNAS